MSNYNFNTNSNPTTGSIAMYTFLATMILSGWTDTQDSDGTTFAPAGGQVTSGNAGANGLGNNRAWFVISNGTSQYCVQRSANNTQWRIKRSPSAGFTGGSPSATQVPSATDEVTILGGGTDAAPTFGTLYPADASYRFNVCSGNSTALWVFYQMFWALGTPSSSTAGLWGNDVMSANTFPAADTDHTVNILQVNQVILLPSNLQEANNTVKGYLAGFVSAHWVSLGVRVYWQLNNGVETAPAASASGDGVNSFTGKDDLLPTPYGRLASLAAPTGYKGIGSLGDFDTVLRASGDTVSVSAPAAKDFIWMSGFVLPWDGSSPIF